MLGAAVLHLRRAAYPQALGDWLVLVFVAAVGFLPAEQARVRELQQQGVLAFAEARDDMQLDLTPPRPLQAGR